MEFERAASELSWSSFSSSMAAEESELLAQFLDSHAFCGEQEGEPSLIMQSLFCSDSYYAYEDINTSMYYWPMENYSKASEYEMQGTRSESMLLRAEDEKNDAESIGTGGKKHSESDEMGAIMISNCKRKIQIRESAADSANKIEIADASPMKKACASSQTVGRNAFKSSKYKKADKNVEGHEVPVLQSSSCYSSEDETPISQEHSREDGRSAKVPAAVNLNGKARAGSGSATDPQSLYARKRRERINERLRILQNLVPNGTKVDISTMLEEAVQYVKFLQLQIKLLSSDELWMYAPIAYNGMNIGLDLKISPS